MKSFKKQILQFSKLLCLTIGLLSLFSLTCNAQSSAAKPKTKPIGSMVVVETILKTNGDQTQSDTKSKSKPIGTIVVVETMLKTSIDQTQSDADIKELQVYSAQTEKLVFNLAGCEKATCDFDLSSLAAGTYKVKALTTSGASFSKTILKE